MLFMAAQAFDIADPTFFRIISDDFYIFLNFYGMFASIAISSWWSLDKVIFYISCHLSLLVAELVFSRFKTATRGL